MSQTPKLWSVLGAATLIWGGSGCHRQAGNQPARHSASVAEDGTARHEPEAAADATSEGPPPPASHPDTPSAAETRFTLPSGAAVCTQDRPELAGVLLAVDVTSYTAPEERVLLRAWLARTLAPSLLESDADPLVYAAPDCGEHLFCLALPEHDAEKAVDRLADFFNAPQLQPFAAAREGAVEQVEELYQRSAPFRLHALAEGLFAGRVAGLSATQPKALDSALGPNAVQSSFPASAHQALIAQLHSTQVSIFSPRGAPSLGKRWMDRMRLKATVPSQNTIAYLPTPPIHIADERFPEAQLLVTWPTLIPKYQNSIRATLAQLAKQIKARRPEVLVLLHEGDAITPRPALRLGATWSEWVELGPEVDAWAAQLGSVPLAASSPTPPAPPCAPQLIPKISSSDPPPNWGRPQVIIWGAQHAKPTEEQL